MGQDYTTSQCDEAALRVCSAMIAKWVVVVKEGSAGKVTFGWSSDGWMGFCHNWGEELVRKSRAFRAET